MTARFLTVAFSAFSVHSKKNIIVSPLQVTCKPNPDDAPKKEYIDYHLYAARRMLQLKNIYSPKTFLPCAYCDGTGFVECPKCNQGCWKCCHTTLIKCHYCRGTGESTPSLHFMPMNYKNYVHQDESPDKDSKNLVELWHNMNYKETTLYTSDHMKNWKNMVG